MCNSETGKVPPWEEMYSDHSKSENNDLTSPKPEKDETGQELPSDQKAMGFLEKIEDRVVNSLANKYLRGKEGIPPSHVLKTQIRAHAATSGLLVATAVLFESHGSGEITGMLSAALVWGTFEARQLNKAYKRYKEKGE